MNTDDWSSLFKEEMTTLIRVLNAAYALGLRIRLNNSLIMLSQTLMVNSPQKCIIMIFTGIYLYALANLKSSFYEY